MCRVLSLHLCCVSFLVNALVSVGISQEQLIAKVLRSFQLSRMQQKAASIGNWIKKRMKSHIHFLAVGRIPITEPFALATNVREPSLRTAEQPCVKRGRCLWKETPAGFLAWTWVTVFTAIIKHVNGKLCYRNWLWKRPCLRVLNW